MNPRPRTESGTDAPVRRGLARRNLITFLVHVLLAVGFFVAFYLSVTRG
jgi:hypothetical protein